jgi:hypothetical protein
MQVLDGADYGFYPQAGHVCNLLSCQQQFFCSGTNEFILAFDISDKTLDAARGGIIIEILHQLGLKPEPCALNLHQVITAPGVLHDHRIKIVLWKANNKNV